MANTLLDTINYIVPFCRYQAANIGTSSQPIIGIANIVRNIILAAPFTWRWNRASLNLTGPVIQGSQDYTQAIANFGFLEKATVTGLDNNGATTTWELKDMKNNEALASSLTQARPMSISVFNDDGSGNYVFRLSGVPDQAYTLNIIYQKASVQFAATTDQWSPIPDSYSDVYNNLCMGYYMDSCQDGRAPQYISRGIAGLLARAQGLTATDKALFAASYMNFNAQMMLDQLRTQQGQQAQGAR
jgi:hypothetical protein